MPTTPDPVDAVVWVADDQVTEGLDYGVRLIQRLRARGLRVRRSDLTRTDGRIPPARLHVMSGGGTSVNDTSGWMAGGLQVAGQLLDEAYHGRHAVLGVCLGSQMIAETLWPGAVRQGERIRAGLIEVDWCPEPLEEAERLVVPAFHYEEVDRAHVQRGGGEVVSLNSWQGLQGFRSGALIWGVQFHPELEPSDVRRLIVHHRETIESHRTTAAQALESVAALEPAWRPEVFDRIVDLVLSPAVATVR
jgi:GMP synthase-like glutamine amidotransferase